MSCSATARVATLRVTRPADHSALRRFFHELSPESLRRRFFSLSDPAETLIDAFCDSSTPTRQATVVALRLADGELRPMAVGSYLDLGHGTAEAAFAVGDAFQRKGLGTILLEHLATMAAANGFQRFEATVLPENSAMLEVFRDSGFGIRSKSERGAVTVLLSLSPTAESVAAAERRHALATVTSMRPLMAPETVAVVGASRDCGGIGRRILDAIVGGGFTGTVYPINPHVSEMDGLHCYRSVADAPFGIAGLTVVAFADDTRARLSAFLPPEASVGNPVDMVASAGPDAYRRAIEVALTTDDVDALIVIYTPVDRRTSAETLQAIRDGIAAGRRAGAACKPVLGCLMAGDGRPLPLDLESERIPVYVFPENAARALGKAAAYAIWRAQPPALRWAFEDIRVDEARAVCRNALDTGGDGWLTGGEVRAVLGAFGLPLAAGTLAHSAEEAAEAALAIGFPVAAKLESRRVLHKTDIGAVQLNLASEAAVRGAFADLLARGRTIVPDADIDGVLIQPMVVGGVETMIGVADDPLFGPLVAFGLGGIHVEVLGDVRFRVTPLTDRDADELLHEIRGVPLLLGYRGHPPADLDALREMLLRVSRLATDVPEIAELDLNPVIALAPGLGCLVVDARVRVRPIG